MDGSTPGTIPPFDFPRWRRQFAVAQLQDLVRDWQNPQPGPEQVLAAMRAAPSSQQGAGVLPTNAWGQVDIYLSAGPVEAA